MRKPRRFQPKIFTRASRQGNALSRTHCPFSRWATKHRHALHADLVDVARKATAHDPDWNDFLNIVLDRMARQKRRPPKSLTDFLRYVSTSCRNEKMQREGRNKRHEPLEVPHQSAAADSGNARTTDHPAMALIATRAFHERQTRAEAVEAATFVREYFARVLKGVSPLPPRVSEVVSFARDVPTLERMVCAEISHGRIVAGTNMSQPTVSRALHEFRAIVRRELVERQDR